MRAQLQLNTLWWNCSFFASMRVHDLHRARPRANIARYFTEILLFLTRHSMRDASRMKLQFVQ